jgi:hypothetical protein
MADPSASVQARPGRPRKLSVRDAVLSAAGQLLLQAGVKGFTIEGVAKLAR